MIDLKPITAEELCQAQATTDAVMAVAAALKCKWQDIPSNIKKIRDEIAYLKEEIAKFKHD